MCSSLKSGAVLKAIPWHQTYATFNSMQSRVPRTINAILSLVLLNWIHNNETTAAGAGLKKLRLTEPSPVRGAFQYSTEGLTKCGCQKRQQAYD